MDFYTLPIAEKIILVLKKFTQGFEMQHTGEKDLFGTHEVCHACGISSENPSWKGEYFQGNRGKIYPVCSIMCWNFLQAGQVIHDFNLKDSFEWGDLSLPETGDL